MALINIDSAAKWMNQRLKDIYNIFGSQSQEYQNARAAIYSSGIPAEFTKEEVNKPIRISRTNKALEGLSNIAESVSAAREAVRGLGTPLQQARKYDPSVSSKRLKGQQEREWLKKASLRNAVLTDAVDDKYTLIDEIDDETEQLRIKRELQDTRGMTGDEYEDRVTEIFNEVEDIIVRQGNEAYEYLTGKSINMPGSSGSASNLRKFYRK